MLLELDRAMSEMQKGTLRKRRTSAVFEGDAGVRARCELRCSLPHLDVAVSPLLTSYKLPEKRSGRASLALRFPEKCIIR